MNTVTHQIETNHLIVRYDDPARREEAKRAAQWAEDRYRESGGTRRAGVMDSILAAMPLGMRTYWLDQCAWCESAVVRIEGVVDAEEAAWAGWANARVWCDETCLSDYTDDAVRRAYP